ncbi:MAG: dockerin type I repeat-containing protein [Phycisphaerales bacterium]
MIRRNLLCLSFFTAMLSPALASDLSRLDEKVAFDAAFRPSEERGALPTNDTCATAKFITTTMLPFSELVNTAAATGDAPPGTCNSGSATVMQNSVWYAFTAVQDCTVTFKAVDQQNYDVIVAVFTGGCGSLSQLTCADEPEPATITFQATQGTTYRFKVGDWGNSAGGGVTEVSLTTTLPNEICATATPITTADFSTTTNLWYANPSPGISNCGFPGTVQTFNDVWYAFTAPTACNVSVSITPIGFEAILALYTSFNDCATTIGGNCGHSTGPQTRTIQLQAGETASIRIGAYSNVTQGGQVNMTFQARAVNDECAGARFIPCNTEIDVHTELGTSSAGDPPLTCLAPGTGPGVNSLWYRFIPSTPSVRLRTLRTGTPHDTVMAVYSGSCGGLVPIACNDDANFAGGDFTSLIQINGLSTSTQYYVRVSAFNNVNVGEFRLMLECPPDCASCPPGAVAELETCGSNTNGGCSTSPPAYQPTAVGTTHCGTMYLRHQSGAIFSDLDAYRVFAPANGTIKWTVRAQADYQALALAPGCPTSILAFVDGTACADGTVQTPVTAGQELILAVRPSGIFGTPAFDCDSLSKYVATSAFVPACPGDLNGDGQRNTADLVIFLGDFGTGGPGILADLNNDGSVNTIDLTQFLGKFGVPCP